MSIFGKHWVKVPAHILNQNGTVRIKGRALNDLLRTAFERDEQLLTLEQEVISLKAEIRSIHAQYSARNHLESTQQQIPILLKEKI